MTPRFAVEQKQRLILSWSFVRIHTWLWDGSTQLMYTVYQKNTGNLELKLIYESHGHRSRYAKTSSPAADLQSVQTDLLNQLEFGSAIGIHETAEVTLYRRAGMQLEWRVSSTFFFKILARCPGPVAMMCTKNYFRSIRPPEQQNDNAHWHKTWKMV